MSPILEIDLSREEVDAIREVVHEMGMTVPRWVRQTLNEASSRITLGDSDRKLGAIRRAVHHSFPTSDMDEMLSDIGRRSCNDS